MLLECDECQCRSPRAGQGRADFSPEGRWRQQVDLPDVQDSTFFRHPKSSTMAVSDLSHLMAGSQQGHDQAAA